MPEASAVLFLLLAVLAVILVKAGTVHPGPVLLGLLLGVVMSSTTLGAPIAAGVASITDSVAASIATQLAVTR